MSVHPKKKASVWLQIWIQNPELNEKNSLRYLFCPQKLQAFMKRIQKNIFANCKWIRAKEETPRNWKSSACSCCTTEQTGAQEQSIGKHELLFRKMHPNRRMDRLCARERPSWCPKLQIMLQCQESAHYSKFLPSREWQINLCCRVVWRLENVCTSVRVGDRQSELCCCNYIANALHWYEKQF